MSEEATDAMLRTALRDHIAALGDADPVIVGYAVAVEVITPDIDGPWLKVLTDSDSTPWTQVGRITALLQLMQDRLRDWWTGDDE